MILKKHRFHGYNSLRFVYTSGKTVRTSLFAIRFAPNTRRKEYRCAVVVSKKVSKSAVVRNRIRRRIYELVRANQDSLGAVDIVVTIYNEQVATMPYAELHKTFENLLAQAKISTPSTPTPS